MTVKELIQVLKKMPQDSIVVCGGYSDMIKQEEPTLMEVLRSNRGVDMYEKYYPNQWKHEKPKTLIVCHFEGN